MRASRSPRAVSYTHLDVYKRQVLERHPEVVVLVLAMVEDDASLAAAIEAKASGYILKACLLYTSKLRCVME